MLNKAMILRVSVSLMSAFILFSACSPVENKVEDITMSYSKLLNVTHTPTDKRVRGQGYFTDHGSWMGFTIPEKNSRINGFCGPFDLDHRRWISHSFANVGVIDSDNTKINAQKFAQDSIGYYPGKIVLESSFNDLNIKQQLVVIDERCTLLKCESNGDIIFELTGQLNIKDSTEFVSSENNVVEYKLANGEIVVVAFPEQVNIELDMQTGTYMATSKAAVSQIYVVIAYFNTEKDYMQLHKDAVSNVLNNPDLAYHNSVARWNKYIQNNLRDDMPQEYNRILIKSMMTLMSNWRSPKGALYHSGVVPSHAMDYFVGFWAWDSWKHAVALAYIDADLAKDQVRTMFDYQSEEGMIADCIYTNIKENNWRDSKPPLAAWAVDHIFKATKDTTFVAEMYPKLLKYHEWWYKYRDHDKNGICEFGATDGTLEAAKWESGMDNAVRFDDAKMLKNSDGAWSFDQESIDLNAYLCYEQAILKEMANILGETYTIENRTSVVKDYFFDSKDGYFYDKRIKGDFIREQGPEGWTPIWTETATADQVKEAVKIMFDTAKFSTYIPFPTLAADNKKFTPKGYWRGPIWLDQVYFAISGIRKYGYKKEADMYTDQIFSRLEGLNEDGPIHENYETSSGKRLKASHFSWSSAHLIMLYKEYGK